MAADRFRSSVDRDIVSAQALQRAEELEGRNAELESLVARLEAEAEREDSRAVEEQAKVEEQLLENLQLAKAEAFDATQVIPPVPSWFTLLRPYLAHFFPVFSRFLCVFTAWPRRFHRAPSRNPGPRNSWQGDQEGRTPPFVRRPRR